MDELLKITKNRLSNGIQYLYNRHNTKINSSSIEYIILEDFKRNVSKKINSNVMLNISMLYNKVLNFAESEFRFKDKEEIKKQIDTLLNLKKGLDVFFVKANQNLASISFEEEYSEVLRGIFKSDYVYNEALRQDLKMLFNFESNNLQDNIQKELKQTISIVEEKCKNQIEQSLTDLKKELAKYEKEGTEKVEEEQDKTKEENSIEKETEKKEIFYKAKLEQREQDKMDRASQIESRNMLYNNEENQLIEKGRSL